MKIVSKVNVRLPNGETRRADVGTVSSTGYRHASVQLADGAGGKIRVSGRVTTRHGFAQDRYLPFEVNVRSKNADLLLEDAATDLYAVAG